MPFQSSVLPTNSSSPLHQLFIISGTRIRTTPGRAGKTGFGETKIKNNITSIVDATPPQAFWT
ncbi:9892_t:CDS:2 [Paraglomus brasilianum]|uniref:9892_t:CDS:1 n=1 Tax=Paraglomus brasilianum TaxID=144538 RepID=A0A9N8ZAK3_9GLOM|nr:9892_t:CDS:2 [Paraglomus brasilianum]